ncbi:MAG TPA: Mov34/MPN/PAD-1 family protein [Anaerolineales bacterium]|jgi:proteasome lid subunit RPN8/RPN11
MNQKPAIRIQPVEASRPSLALMPTDSAQKWCSPFDDNGFEPAVKVFVTQPAYALMCVHAASEMHQETGGVMVGQCYEDTGTHASFIVVESALPARFTRQGSVYLTFTQDTIVNFHDEIEDRFPGKQIVGWYHTHPKMGIFLSHYDTWLHSHFFPEPWQVALVIEPHKQLGGLFIRQTDGAFDPSCYFGFYELEENPKWSIVHWNNLHRVEDDTREGG